METIQKAVWETEILIQVSFRPATICYCTVDVQPAMQ